MEDRECKCKGKDNFLSTASLEDEDDDGVCMLLCEPVMGKGLFGGAGEETEGEGGSLFNILGGVVAVPVVVAIITLVLVELEPDCTSSCC